MKTSFPAQIESLFTRYPALCGFSVHGLDELPDNCPRGGEGGVDLFVGDVGISPLVGAKQRGEIFREIVVALAEVLDEDPQADDILRGRTFARVLH
jgi:hypothetical protein